MPAVLEEDDDVTSLWVTLIVLDCLSIDSGSLMGAYFLSGQLPYEGPGVRTEYGSLVTRDAFTLSLLLLCGMMEWFERYTMIFYLERANNLSIWAICFVGK